ncbi:MAG: TrmH family RNA methyltransferase, partial [Candidatus Promineifilaceae bacterium]
VPVVKIGLPPRPNLLLILDQIQTPGNLGTMLRTAAAAGVDGVVLAPGCVDLFNPKVLRGSMGAHLRLGVISAEWGQIETLTNDLNVYAAIVTSAINYTAPDWRQPSALIVGNEANGIGEQAKRLSKGVTIPMSAETESLNAAMASGIILFEASRQRRLVQAAQPLAATTP